MSEPEGMDRNGGTFDTPNSPKESPAHLSTSHEGQSTYPHPNKSNSNDTSIVSDTDTSMVQNDVTGPESLSVHCEESDKTIESQDGVAKIDQEETSNQSRELKLLLALSKEAKLDTNISRKRKVQPLRKKYRGEGRGKSSRIQYPVTAECELEMDLSSADGSKESMQDDDTLSTSSSGKGTKRKKGDMSSNSGLEEGVKKSRKSLSTDVIVFKPNKDMFCWRCHKDNVNIACETCPRSYHQKCLKQTITDLEHWPCPECVAILKAESTNSRSPALQGMTLEHLCSLLKFAVKRMIQCQGSEPFINEVSDNEFPEYKKYIIQPMDLTQLDKNIKENLYGSTQAFEADAKWILHNSIVFNSYLELSLKSETGRTYSKRYQSKLTTAAKLIIKICKQEMSEIENCPSCYLNANTKKKTWFVEVCPKPHLLVWAKLRGFPFWPGKAMKCKDGVVDVRFFGAHDRAWVPEKECFLYSPKDPNLFRVKRADIEQCVEELEIHVDNLRKIYGEFNYPPFKTAIDPDNEVKQLQIFLPMYSSSKTKSLKRQSLDKEQGESKECQELKLKGAISDESFKSTLEEQQTSEKDDDPMEGYGTDDESVPEIDTEFRKTLLHLPENRNDNLEVDEYDTQVPANVEPDTSGTEEVLLTRPVVNDDSKSGSNKSLLEPSSNNSPIGDPAMMSFRRNSDTECTRISDKISRLDIAENVEISLGNDEKGTVSCIENISSSNSECSSDFSVEFKKKPVQVDVDNVEFTISPARKLKMTDTLIKRLSDGECSTSTEENSKLDNVERVKRNFNALDTDETENCASDEIFESKSPSDELLDSVLESSKFVATKIGDSLTKSAQKVAESTVKTVSSGSKNDDKSKNTECVNWTVRDVSQKSDRTKIVIKAVRSEERLDQIGKEGIEEIKDTSEEHQSDAESVIPKAQVVADQQPKESEIGIYVSKSQSDNQEQIETSTHSLYVEEPSIKILLHSMKENSDNVSSNNGAEWALEKKLQSSPDKLKTSKEQVEKKKLPNFHENPTESQKSKSRDHDEVAENEDVRFNIDKSTPLFQESIINIIHSSLNESLPKPVIKSGSHKTNSKECNQLRPSSAENDDTKRGTKRKKSADCEERADETQNKIVKLVSIESIMTKTENNQENKGKNKSSILETSLQAKRITKSAQNSPAGSARSSLHEIAMDEIKSEPETEIEAGSSGLQDMEAKKKYLSALNIQEKGEAGVQKPKTHEIRTRSKTEEKRERFRVSNESQVVDNMTKIIDDVAINYSAVREEDRLSHLNKKKPTGTANGSKSDGCEIYVRSFAKIATTVPEINTSMIPTPPSKQKARKSFPQPNYSKVVRPSIHPQPSVSKPSSVESPARVASRPPTAVATAKPIISPLQQIDQVRPTNGYFILQPPQQDNLVFLPPNQTLSYTAPLASLANQVMSVTPCLVSATATGQAVRHITTQAQLWHPGLSQDEKGINPVNLATSQNYIPQGEFGVTPSSITLTNPQNSKVDGNTKRLVNGLIAETPTINLVNSSSEWTASVPSSVASAKPTNTEKPSETAGDSATETALPTITALPVVEPIVIADGDEDFTVLNGLVPDTNISKIISDVILKPLPRLKPRPPGVLSQQFSEGVPSTAGPVAAKINSIAHRLGDYFRGMLIETFEDLSKADNPDATIVNLKLEIESLKYKHSIEISEIERNLTTALKDIQRTILEDRERIVEETRTACEAETIKKVEEAKSKQWCANCSKEAQFYCCWNTSYCDYPCQQKHWSTHMGKCAQSVNPTGQITPSPAIRPGSQQIILRPTNPPAKAGLGRVFSKPVQKVFMNRGLSGSKAMRVQTTTGSLLTMMETTPGNYQLVPSTTVLRAGPTLTIKPNVITVPSANISSTSSSIANQQPQKPKPAVRLIGHSMPVTTALDDDSE
ncbi:uncharacterized protein Zmynd8 isoform X10 [Euwallacea fornicatus]|uniref:uncharacterized protein Zmynd8 isoform X10 n=1 Tax=Euwallacea fornicatus TaxID=995702 RepID=UPI00338E3C59